MAVAVLRPNALNSCPTCDCVKPNDNRQSLNVLANSCISFASCCSSGVQIARSINGGFDDDEDDVGVADISSLVCVDSIDAIVKLSSSLLIKIRLLIRLYAACVRPLRRINFISPFIDSIDNCPFVTKFEATFTLSASSSSSSSSSVSVK
ncbi:hypothetical protein DERP_000686 [Dermatophagoides pteronyssinus]|uniref:Uncharacterized protein n=1 Tax=Dermatophagoides pteronyssinus TaxID=6956 RepID=A0ABQ8J0W1_DERPT|nr:hypothetical protein DERP_000686 [Dermatophagoides pteronyssinus]